jgi:hypothetical protein
MAKPVVIHMTAHKTMTLILSSKETPPPKIEENCIRKSWGSNGTIAKPKWRREQNTKNPDVAIVESNQYSLKEATKGLLEAIIVRTKAATTIVN